MKWLQPSNLIPTVDTHTPARVRAQLLILAGKRGNARVKKRDLREWVINRDEQGQNERMVAEDEREGKQNLCFEGRREGLGDWTEMLKEVESEDEGVMSEGEQEGEAYYEAMMERMKEEVEREASEQEEGSIREEDEKQCDQQQLEKEIQARLGKQIERVVESGGVGGWW